jgi:hypothetical protein
MVKKSYELRMNWSRLKKQLIWAVGTSMDEEAPYSPLVKLLASQAYYYLKSEVESLLECDPIGQRNLENALDVIAREEGEQLGFDDSLNEHSCDEPFPAYTLGRDPNTLDVIHRD